jgi:hypothetical protein
MERKLEIKLTEVDLEKINLTLGNKGVGSKGIGNTLTDLTPLKLLIKVNGACNALYYGTFLKGLIKDSSFRNNLNNFFKDPYYFSKSELNTFDHQN